MKFSDQLKENYFKIAFLYLFHFDAQKTPAYFSIKIIKGKKGPKDVCIPTENLLFPNIYFKINLQMNITFKVTDKNHRSGERFIFSFVKNVREKQR